VLATPPPATRVLPIIVSGSLRLLGINSSIRTNTNFLVGTFRKWARNGGYPRVLVSATADYSMLAHLRSAYETENARLDAAVVDRCETSLFLNRWYAARYRLPLATECTSILDYESSRRFDLVCAHNFL
jgi:hypothetical protein